MSLIGDHFAAAVEIAATCCTTVSACSADDWNHVLLLLLPLPLLLPVA